MSFILRKCVVDLPKNIIHVRVLSQTAALQSDKVPEEAIPKNLLEPYNNEHLQPFGDIYDKRPFRVKLEKDKEYWWCSCGQSKSQPFCDGTHNIIQFKIKNRPIPLKVAETKEYWLCNCKQSAHRPFCDGTHKNEEIQSKLKYFKT